MTAKLEDMLRKVRALLAQAEHPNTAPTEAQTFRDKAEALMFRYRIDETMLSAEEKAAQGIAVKWSTLDVCDVTSEFASFYHRMAYAIITHFEVRSDYIRTQNRHTGDIETRHTVDDLKYVIEIVGFESDLRMIEMVYTSAQMAFGKRLEPTYDPSLSDQVNAYLMRSAGMEGWRIAQAIYGKMDKALRPKVRAMFKAEAEARGEDPAPLLGKGSNMKLYRESYASGFVDSLQMQLRTMARSRAAVETGLVLAGRKEQIDEAFYARFPERRPRPVPQLGEARIEECPKCKAAKSGYCRDHAWMRPRKGRTRYANGTAWNRGASAARETDFGIRSREVGS